MLKKTKKSLKIKSEEPKAKKTNSTSKKSKRDVQEDLNAMIREAAYFRAEKRNFVGGDPVEDWLAVEMEITNNSKKTKASVGKNKPA